jgi:hypothetical protein
MTGQKTDTTSPLLDQLVAEADDADAVAFAEQERRRQAWERHEKGERCCAAVYEFLHAEEGHDPARMHQTLGVACAALQETGRLKDWEQVDHEQTYRERRYWNHREMALPTYRVARRLFDAACKGELTEDEMLWAWQKKSLRDAFRWLRLFLYGLSGEAIILCFKSKVTAPLAAETLRGYPALPVDAAAFVDFSPKQRVLLVYLSGHRSLAIAEVKQAVYGTQNKATKTLEQLVVRTNRSLSQKNCRFEIKRKSNTLALHPI